MNTIPIEQVVVIQVNIVAILIASVVSMVIGAVWYSPGVFGKLWMQLSGISPEACKKEGTAGMVKKYVGQFAALLLTNWVFAWIIAALNLTGLVPGLRAGFWMWLGFVVPLVFGAVLWEGKPFKLYIINIGQYLLTLSASGAIMAMMR
jgi:hypothetical protein